MPKTTVVDGAKPCTGCREWFPVGEFFRRSSRCRPCKRAYDLAWRDKNREALRAKGRENYAANPPTRERAKARYEAAKAADPFYARRRRVALRGMSLEQFDEMLERQGGVCAICDQPESIKGSSLSVDHCHHSGKIRGLLCRNCNSAIGKLKDDPNLIESALEYLRGHGV